MLYALIAVVCLLVIFVIVSYFLMKKTYKFQIEDKTIIVKNEGSNLKVLDNDKLISFSHYPDLLKGENLDFKIGENSYTLKCRSNAFGYKIRMEIYHDDRLICDNGVVLKNR